MLKIRLNLLILEMISLNFSVLIHCTLVSFISEIAYKSMVESYLIFHNEYFSIKASRLYKKYLFLLKN